MTTQIAEVTAQEELIQFLTDSRDSLAAQNQALLRAVAFAKDCLSKADWARVSELATTFNANEYADFMALATEFRVADFITINKARIAEDRPWSISSHDRPMATPWVPIMWGESGWLHEDDWREAITFAAPEEALVYIESHSEILAGSEREGRKPL